MAIATPAPQRAAGRRKLARAKKALPDGSFPIPNVDYLGRAIRAVGRAAPGKRPALARLIRKRARQLGGAGMAKLRGSWADNAQSKKAMANACYRQFLELGFTPELARAETQATMSFMVLELATPVVGSMDGPRTVATSEGDGGGKTRRGGTKPLVSKASVHYRDATDSKRCCGTCANMRGTHCSVVSGTVKRDDVCDRWSSAGYANSHPALSLAGKKSDSDSGDSTSASSGAVDSVSKLDVTQKAVLRRLVAQGKNPREAYQIASRVRKAA